MSVFQSPSFDHHELVAFHDDPASGLRAIIAVHDTTSGPAVGGCRMYPYTDDSQALEDVLRLSRGMTYKSALAGLPLGGGKAVIIGDPRTRKTPELLRAMGRFIDSLGGKYITAEDSGTCVADMKLIGESTAFVSGVDETSAFGGDPSPSTALGVYVSIKAAVRCRLGKASLNGLSVAVQGAGAVGRHLIRHLLADGAVVYVADINPDNLAQAVNMGAIAVSVEDILFTDCDVLAPCAMGAVINGETVDKIRAPVIAGAANNQLAEPGHGDTLRARGILYAPDFVVNAGGIIAVHYLQQGLKAEDAASHVRAIAGVATTVFERADAQQVATSAIAERMAGEILAKAKHSGCRETARTAA